LLSTELQQFWDSLHHFFLTLIIHLDQSNTLPKDPQFSLAEAAHNRVLVKFDHFTDVLPEYVPITVAEWQELFD
jgi:hypothetical protein